MGKKTAHANKNAERQAAKNIRNLQHSSPMRPDSGKSIKVTNPLSLSNEMSDMSGSEGGSPRESARARQQSIKARVERAFAPDAENRTVAERERADRTVSSSAGVVGCTSHAHSADSARATVCADM